MDEKDTIRLIANDVALMRDAIERFYEDDPKRREAAREWYEKVMEGMRNGKTH